MAAVLGLQYSQQLTASGGTGPYVFSMKSGSPPLDIKLSREGLLAGLTVAPVGFYTFTVQVIDGFNGYGEREYTLEVIDGSNEFAVELAALSPDHSWPMDEVSGDYLDEVGALDLAEGTALQLWREAPGLIRGAPIEYGVWGTTSVSSRFIIGPLGDVPVAAGWTTGTLNCFIMQFDAQDNGATPFTPFSVGGSNGVSATSSVRIEVDNLGAVRGIVGNAGSGNRNYATSVNGVVSFGIPYMLSLVQRGDGTGIHVLVNGVDVTNTVNTGGSGTLDSFIDDLFSGGIASHITVNGQQTGGGGGARAIVQRPAVWRNVALSDAQLLALYNSANLDGFPTDYYAFCLENYVIPGDCKWWMPGWVAPSGNRMVDAGTVGRGATTSDMTASNIGTINQDDNDRITAYENYKSLVGASNNTSLSQVNLSGFATGTIHVLLTFQEVSESLTKFVIGIGGFSGTKMTLCFTGVSGGYKLSVSLGDNNLANTLGTNGYRLNTTVADGVPVAGFVAGLMGLWSIVQDGVTGLKIYRDGVLLVPETPIVNGSGFDQDSWWNNLSTSSDVFAWGFPSAVSTNGFINNEFQDVMILPGRALTAPEVLAHWNAVNGSF